MNKLCKRELWSISLTMGTLHLPLGDRLSADVQLVRQDLLGHVPAQSAQMLQILSEAHHIHLIAVKSGNRQCIAVHDDHSTPGRMRPPPGMCSFR